MAGLLPSKPDIDPNDEPRVVGLDSDDADELIDALSSSTTRAVLAALHEEPASASALADRVDTSLQNVQYHLRKLQDAGLVEVGDTVYSEKGREMNVYVPADRALVVVAGRDEETTGLKSALSRLLGGVGVLGLASVVVDRLAREGAIGLGATGGAGKAGDGGAAPPETATGDTGVSGGAAAPTPEPTATQTATEAPTATATQAQTQTDGGFQIAEATTTTTAPTEATTVTDAAATGTQTPMATPMPTATELATRTATATPESTAMPTETVAEATAQATTTVTTGAQPGLLDGLASSPGLLFFLGGTTVLLGGFALWWIRQ